MSQVHMYVGIAVLSANALAGAWGVVAWMRRVPSVWFWYVLRVAQATVVVQATLGFVLVASGRQAADDLHIVYGVAPLLIAFFSEGMRAGVAERELEDVEDLEGLEPREQVAIARRVAVAEMSVMTIGTLLILTLALRAFQTGS